MAVLAPYLFAMKLYEHPEGLGCQMHWEDIFGESSSVKNYHVAIVVVHIFIPWVLIAILYIIIFLKLKSQKIRPTLTSNASRGNEMC